MKILIYGGNGWIGKQFIELCNLHNIIVSNNKVDNYDILLNEIESYKPDRIVCMIGRTHGPNFSTIDYLEQSGKLVENIHDNLYGPLLLAQISSKLNIHMTYLGTGCIFTYKDNKNIFTEDDVPNFFGSSYSIVKGYTDQLMKTYNNILNVRIRMPITSKKSPRNFITKIVSYKKICSIQNSMTVLDELLPILLDMIEKSTTGTINLTNPGTIEHNQILNMYKEIIDPTHTWENFTQEEQLKILKSDRSNNELDNTLLLKLYPNVKNIIDSIRETIKNYK